MQTEEKFITDLIKKIRYEKNSLQESLDDNLLLAKENDAFLSNAEQLYDSESTVFSPRVKRTDTDEHIAEFKDKKKVLDKQIEEISQKLKEKESILKQLENYRSQHEKEKKASICERDVLDIQEKERQRIARDLHDGTLQDLTNIIHKMELGSLYIDKDPVRAKLEIASCQKCLRETIEEIRNIVYDLRPMVMDDLGLTESLKRMIDQYRNEINDAHKNVRINSDIQEIECNDSVMALTLFRIIKECISNAVEHADANEIDVKIEKEKSLYAIRIDDNGKGFSTKDLEKNHHFGMKILKERVAMLSGQIRITSKEGTGTKISIKIPEAEEKNEY